MSDDLQGWNKGDPCLIEGCEAPSHSRGWCPTHYGRWHDHGDPLYKRHIPSIEERFWSKVDKRGEDECWPWTASTSGGYGSIGDGNGGLIKAHRLSLEMHTGEKLVHNALHTCDNPPCVNPKHLYEGTQLDNALDRDARGRSGTRKLSKEDVVYIRSSSISALALSREMGVSDTTVRCARLGITWKNL